MFFDCYKFTKKGLGFLMLKKNFENICKFYPYDLYADSVLKGNEIVVIFYKSFNAEFRDSIFDYYNGVL